MEDKKKSTDLTKKMDASALVEQVLKGTIDESQMGTVLKALQISMATSLLETQQKATELLIKATSKAAILMEKFEEKFEAEVNANTIEDADTMWTWIDRFHRMQINVAELQRKIVQGKSLFNTEVMSEDERMVIQLLSSFKTKEDKKKFLDVVKETLEKQTVPTEFD